LTDILLDEHCKLWITLRVLLTRTEFVDCLVQSERGTSWRTDSCHYWWHKSWKSCGWSYHSSG